MATIETRRSSDGTTTYRAKVRLKGHPAQHATFLRKTEARQWAHSLEAAIRDGRYFPASEATRHTFAETADRYLLEVAPQRPKSLKKATFHLTYWKRKIGGLALSEITPSRIVACRNELLGQTTCRNKLRANATVVRYLAALSHVFTVATKDWQWASENPVMKISKPREPRGRERFLTDEERERLLDACRASGSRYLLPVVVLAISTGMRRGEIMNLKWSDVNFSRSVIVLTETKNGTSRSVPLVGLAHRLLEGLSDLQRDDTALIFYGGVKTKPMDLKRPWDAALRAAKLDNFRFHDLRHTAASYLAMNGATTMEIAEVLGHKTLAMVKRYSHLTSSHTASVVAAMNERVFGAGSAHAPGQRHNRGRALDAAPLSVEVDAHGA